MLEISFGQILSEKHNIRLDCGGAERARGDAVSHDGFLKCRMEIGYKNISDYMIMAIVEQL